MLSRFIFFGFLLAVFSGELYGEPNPLSPVRTDSPRETVKTFYQSMEQYRRGVEEGDPKLQKKIDRAVRAFDFSSISKVIYSERSTQSAVYLKEILDRIMVLDLKKIPDARAVHENSLKSWHFPDTEIVIKQIDSGDREGEFLISSHTVERLEEFYRRVEHLKYKKGAGKGALYQEPWLENKIPDWARDSALGLYHWQWIGIFLSILIGLFLKNVSQFSVRLIKSITQKSSVTWDDKIVEAIDRPIGLLVASLFWFFCLKLLRLENGFGLSFLAIVIQVVFSYSAIWLVYRLVDILTDYLESMASKTESALDDQLVPLVTRAIRLFVVVFGVLISIQNLGVNVMSLVAGLGLGGLAFALAAKDTAANLFGSIMILWDQPFRVGDWVRIDSAEGTIEEIGFRSTRVRTFYDSQISIPNSKVANANIDNMGRRSFRRVTADLGVTYDTSAEKLEVFLEGIKNIIKANPVTRKDYFHVVFKGYGPSSLDIMLYFFIKVPSWSEELVAKQNIYLEILRFAKEISVDFAFPTQTLHVESFPEKKPTRIVGTANPEELEGVAKDFGRGGKSAKPEGLGFFVPPHVEPNN